MPDEDIIDIELVELSFMVSVENADLIAPENIEDSYRAWRAETHPAAPVQAPTQSPAPAETQPSTGGQQQGNQNRTPQSGGTQQTGGGTYTPPPVQVGTPSGDLDGMFTDPYKGLTPEEREAQIQADREGGIKILSFNGRKDFRHQPPTEIKRHKKQAGISVPAYFLRLS